LKRHFSLQILPFSKPAHPARHTLPEHKAHTPVSLEKTQLTQTDADVMPGMLLKIWLERRQRLWHSIAGMSPSNADAAAWLQPSLLLQQELRDCV
jgi:hypothetical protein